MNNDFDIRISWELDRFTTEHLYSPMSVTLGGLNARDSVDLAVRNRKPLSLQSPKVKNKKKQLDAIITVTTCVVVYV